MRASNEKISSMMKGGVTPSSDHTEGIEGEKNTAMREKNCNTWCQLRISILCFSVALSFFVNTSLCIGQGVIFCWSSPPVFTAMGGSGPVNGLTVSNKTVPM